MSPETSMRDIRGLADRSGPWERERRALRGHGPSARADEGDPRQGAGESREPRGPDLLAEEYRASRTVGRERGTSPPSPESAGPSGRRAERRCSPPCRGPPRRGPWAGSPATGEALSEKCGDDEHGSDRSGAGRQKGPETGIRSCPRHAMKKHRTPFPRGLRTERQRSLPRLPRPRVTGRGGPPRNAEADSARARATAPRRGRYRRGRAAGPRQGPRRGDDRDDAPPDPEIQETEARRSGQARGGSPQHVPRRGRDHDTKGAAAAATQAPATWDRRPRRASRSCGSRNLRRNRHRRTEARKQSIVSKA
jgi:hypothetical protein